LPPSGDRSKAVMMMVIADLLGQKSSAARLGSCQGKLSGIEDDPFTLK
jgi:hypothetical protein